MCGDSDLAEELSQEAFTRALNHWARLKGYERPAGWLYRTAFNLLRSHWRATRRTELESIVEPREAFAEGERIDLVRLLSGLPFAQREAVVLRHVLDYSTEEAAEIAGVSLGALRMTLHRAMENLRTRANIELAEEAP